MNGLDLAQSVFILNTVNTGSYRLISKVMGRLAVVVIWRSPPGPLELSVALGSNRFIWAGHRR